MKINLNAHKYKNIKKSSTFQAKNRIMFFFLLVYAKMLKLLAFKHSWAEKFSCIAKLSLIFYNLGARSGPTDSYLSDHVF